MFGSWLRWASGLLCVLAASAASADPSCRVLTYEFQPLAYDVDHEFPGSPPNAGTFEEGGPQAAIWIETVPPPGVSRGSFVADVFVTARTAIRGLGNRPGENAFVSSPKFPYGARENVLPVWAFAKGRQYSRLVMQDGLDTSFGFHEASSSPEDFFCRPLQRSEIDGITCPTPIFSSDKGKFESSGKKVLYPPRADVMASRCKAKSGGCDTCRDDDACAQLQTMNDVAAVSGATRSPYVSNPPGTWIVPDRIPDGDYLIFLEVNKQFDQDAPRCQGDPDCPSYAPLCDGSSNLCARHPSTYDRSLPSYGLGSNIGQPSVVWKVPVRIDRSGNHVGRTVDYAGYGDWDFPRGNLFPPDATISQRNGSGAARISRVTDADGSWRFKVTARSDSSDLPPPPPVEGLTASAPEGSLITVSFTHVGVGTRPVDGYQVRWRNGETMSDDEFATANPGPIVPPGTPGASASFMLSEKDGILAQRTFAIGVRAVGSCQKLSPLQVVSVTTPRQNYTTLSGCFVATAAYGSELGPEVAALRGFRDQILLRHPVGQSLVALYYQTSPPLARILRLDSNLRAATREILRPLANAAKAVLGLRAWIGSPKTIPSR